MKRVLLSLLVALIALSMTSSIVLAAISVPDSGPYIIKVDVYRHVLEDDDMLVVARYNSPYESTPTETITQAFLARFMNSTTELARTSPYAYYNKGYGYGGFSVYLDAVSAPAWEGSYNVDLLGSPTLDWLGNTATSSMTGAVADDGGVQTDETTAANEATANDMTLLPATPAINDAYYLGGIDVFSLTTLNLGTQGVGVWTVVWEYYDGDGWSEVADLIDGTSGFRATVGNHDISFVPPSDWALTTIDSISSYWIRGRVSVYTSVTTQPKGTQAWLNSGGDPPSVSTSSLNWRGTTTTPATQALMYAHLIAYADELSDRWSVALTSSTASGTVLSAYGEAYFTNMIPELRTMCPTLFAAGVVVPQYEDVDWQLTQAEAIEDSWPFDWGGISEWFGLPSSDEVFRTLIGFGIVFVLCAALMAKTNRTDFTLIAGFGLLVVAAVPGWISPIIVAGFTFVTLLGVALVFIVGKA